MMMTVTTVTQLAVLLVLLLILQSAGAQSDPAYAGPWRNSLTAEDSCWTMPPTGSCNRALTIVHGGDWDLKYPYDSMPAFQRGFDNQADAVKGDFRVNRDSIGMVMHSSPVEWFESFNCWKKKVEEMSTEECEKCKMEVTDYTFISVPELLSWANGKVNCMFCVKLDSDIPRAITTLLENNATTRAFLEVGLGPYLATVAANTPHWQEVFYILEVSTSADVQTFVSQPPEVTSRCILVEFQKQESWGSSLDSDIALVRKLGLRAVGVTKSNSLEATKQAQLDILRRFDVVYTYNLGNAVEARVEVNTQRGLPMP